MYNYKILHYVQFPEFWYNLFSVDWSDYFITKCHSLSDHIILTPPDILGVLCLDYVVIFCQILEKNWDSFANHGTESKLDQIPPTPHKLIISSDFDSCFALANLKISKDFLIIFARLKFKNRIIHRLSWPWYLSRFFTLGEFRPQNRQGLTKQYRSVRVTFW